MTAEQLQAARAAHWRQNQSPILTLDDAQSWLEQHPLCLYLPRQSQLPAPAPLPAWLNGIRERVEAGIDPTYVGELVREGIEGDWPYIFTDNEFEPYVDGRFAAIKAGFDRIRGRTPPH